MEYTYITQGVCSRAVRFVIEDGIIVSVEFDGGCSGNTQGVGKLAVGMKPEEVIQRLKGIRCGFKETSCPDQLAKGLEEALGLASSEEKAACAEKN
ncbi:MAG TPA: TIGR03905 family TSCPD domain-containing protein [Clostridia bacterium]|nr:TIGR03905 family TSCPD domain-containing protein [Clostridia bacterium]